MATDQKQQNHKKGDITQHQLSPLTYG